MKKKTTIFAIILTVLTVLTLCLTACNKGDILTATFTLDENDGISDFLLRRGVYFNYKMTELNKIDGIETNWEVNSGTVNIKVSGDKMHLDEVRAIINSEPSLKFKTENSATADAQFIGKDNVKSITLSADRASIQIEFTASGIETVNSYLNRQLYLYFGDEHLIDMTSRVMLSNANATVTLPVPADSNPMFPETLTAQLNVATFGLKIKNVKIK